MDKRFAQDKGRQAFTGNELILKGALEAGTGLITGYPGSPVSDVFDAVGRAAALLSQKGVVAQLANNEALAAARLNGARIAGLRGLAVMKSVGMHVAADGLAIGNLAETKKPEGGAMVIVGDDPWNETTQINSDSRFLSMHLHMPVLEPATFQEVKDWIKDGFELSGLSDLYVTYVLTTNQADGGATVLCRPNPDLPVSARQKTTLSSSALPVEELVMIPPHTSLREATLAARRERFLAGARQRGLNRIFWNGAGDRAPVGFVSSGLSFCYLSQALEELGAADRFPLLKWGVTYPLDEELLLDFARRVDHVVVIEEKRDFLETQIVRALQRAVQDGRLAKTPGVWGKQFPGEREGVPSVRGINVSVLVDRLAPLAESGFLPGGDGFRRRAVEAARVARDTAAAPVVIPVRTPTFCPGCPHRDSSAVSKAIKADFKDAKYMDRRHDRAPVDVIFHGESGCHSMLQFEPNVGLMQNYSGMGLGGGTGAGVDPFVDNKQVVFLGDSTFFHSGMVAVSDSLKNNQDITYVILQNGTTAMTGHQPTPGAGRNLTFEPTFAQDIEQLLRGMARDSVPIHRVNPAYRDSYRALLEDVILKPGVKIIIADKECGITYQRRLRREKKKIRQSLGYLPEEKFVNITPEVCEYCLECTNATGCPGLAVEETLHGPKIVTDKSLCVADGACAKGKVCPSFEEVVVRRRAAPVRAAAAAKQDPPPATPFRPVEDAWFCYTAGVGGMGSGVVTGVLVEAGRMEGYHVLFADKKGLAIRNGGVYGHVIYAKKEKPFAPLVPYGRADLLIGIDILEAARGLDPKVNLRVASPDRTAAVVNTHKAPTVRVLLGTDDFKVTDLEDILRTRTRPGELLSLDFSALSEELFGSALYANVLLLGAAYQRGLLPVSWDNMTAAVRAIVPPLEVEENLRALRAGRLAAARPDLHRRHSSGRLPSYREVLEDKTAILKGRLFGAGLARAYRKMVEDAARWMDVEEPFRAKLAQYVYDLVQYDGPAYARRYLERLWAVYRKDRADLGRAAFRAVLENLYRAMAIKDEVYVAHLLTSVEKRRRDRERYGLDPKRGDRIQYIHLNRPCFTIFGRNIEFDLKGRDWQFQVMKRLKFLRALLPDWHARERSFRAWYETLVDGFQYFADDSAYRLYAEALRAPETVRGYREIRAPKMDAARAHAEALLSRLPGRGGPPPQPVVRTAI